MPTLPDSINAVYAAFEMVPRPKQIEGCPCCTNPAELRKLLEIPVRDLPDELVSVYASKALTTIGSESDWLYFLPRIIQFHAESDVGWPDVALTFQKFSAIPPELWSPGQRESIEVVVATMVDIATLDADVDVLDDWLCAASQAASPLAPHLARVEASHECVLKLFEMHQREVEQHALRDGFWMPESAGAKELIEWFHTPAVRKILRDAWGYELPGSINP